MVAQYVSEKVSDLSAFIFFRILHGYVSNEYRYRIRIQVSDTLWVEVSMFHRWSLELYHAKYFLWSEGLK
jgi:hypothetical protein